MEAQLPADACGHGSETPSSIKDGEFFDYLTGDY